MELKKHLNYISTLALASLCLFSLLPNNNKQITVNATGERALYSEVTHISFSGRTDTSSDGVFSFDIDIRSNYDYIDGSINLLSFDYRTYILVYTPDFIYTDEYGDIADKPYNTGLTPTNVATTFEIENQPNITYEFVLQSFDYANELHFNFYGNTFYPLSSYNNELALYHDYIVDFSIAKDLYIQHTCSTEAYNDGYDIGYSNGYQTAEGLTLEENGFAILLGSIFNAPVSMFRGMFNFEIFGINFRAIMTLLLTVGVVVLAISIFKGKE